MIEFRSVRKTFADANGKETVALHGLDLRIEPGQVHCLIGTSGCGKTTSLRLVNRLEEPTSGQVLVDGEDVCEVDVIALRRRIGYVIQSGGLFPHLTIAKNVGVLCDLEGHAAKDVEQRVHALLELVNLAPSKFAGRYPKELSGGQRQRVGIARALALDPKYLLMDEPFGALDPLTRGELLSELQSLFSNLGKTVLLVTHDLNEAFALGQRVSVMHEGHLIQTGSRQDLMRNPATEFVANFVKTAHGGAN
ncbi:MAG: osmoprotectant transport system ATP-binding protein [Hyphomicrobiaceae bacterium]